MLLFFFSSRRRHTRCLSDWSSDVCSSDLESSLKGTDAAQSPPLAPVQVQKGLSTSSGQFTALFTVAALDRKSTRLNSSHLGISYAVFCLKKKKQKKKHNNNV